MSDARHRARIDIPRGPMYAVIETGGKQYRVEVGTELEIELIDAQPGQAVTLDRVLLVGDGDDTAIGRPIVANAAVEAEVLRRDRGDKVIVFKYRPKARRRVKKGHRQDHTILRVTDVKLGNKSAAALVRKQEQDAKTERQRLEEAAARQAAEDAALAAKLAKRTDTPKTTAKTTTKTTTKGSGAAGSDAKPKATGTRSTRARNTGSAGSTSASKSASAEKPARGSRGKASGGKATTDSAAESPKPRRTKKDE
jgi:large subunit ribosomal protein L21